MTENKEPEKVEKVRGNEVQQENTISSESTNSTIQRFSIVKVVVWSVLAALFIGSVFLNISLMTKESSDPSPSETFHWVLIIGLIIVTTISLVISFWTYYVRSIYIKDGPALVPEKWGSIIGKLIEDYKIHHSQSQMSLAKVQQSSEDQSRKSDDLLESFLILRNTLNSKDEEIARLKKGYDAKIFKKFLRRFIRIYQSLREMEQELGNQEHEKNYKYLSRIMQDALEECGVEKFTPEIGSDFRKAGPEIADDTTVRHTDDESQDFMLAEVESIGYILEGEGKEVIVPSKVAIFRFNTRDKGEE